MFTPTFFTYIIAYHTAGILLLWVIIPSEANKALSGAECHLIPSNKTASIAKGYPLAPKLPGAALYSGYNIPVMTIKQGKNIPKEEMLRRWDSRRRLRRLSGRLRRRRFTGASASDGFAISLSVRIPPSKCIE